MAPHLILLVPFDSGVGGMVCKLPCLPPHEEFHYFGDSAFALMALNQKRRCPALLCWSLKSLLLRVLSAGYSLQYCYSCYCRQAEGSYPHVPIVGVEPALEPAVTAYPHGTVIVLATKATLSLQKYHNASQRLHPSAKVISIQEDWWAY